MSTLPVPAFSKRPGDGVSILGGRGTLAPAGSSAAARLVLVPPGSFPPPPTCEPTTGSRGAHCSRLRTTLAIVEREFLDRHGLADPVRMNDEVVLVAVVGAEEEPAVVAVGGGGPVPGRLRGGRRHDGPAFDDDGRGVRISGHVGARAAHVLLEGARVGAAHGHGVDDRDGVLGPGVRGAVADVVGGGS